MPTEGPATRRRTHWTRDSMALERTGSGVSWRWNALDPGFHGAARLRP